MDRAGYYKGWRINDAPIGGSGFSAVRFGVRVSARTKKELKEVIDLKIQGDKEWMRRFCSG